MIYDTTADLEMIRFYERLSKAITDKKMIEFKVKNPPKAKNAQHNYLHLILTWFGLELGYTLEEVKQDIFKRQICKDIFMIESGFVSSGDGKSTGLQTCRSVSDLDSGERTIAIEKFRNFASNDLGIYLPGPNEEAMLKSLEIQVRNRLQYV